MHDHPSRVDDRYERRFESGCELRCGASLDGGCRLFTVLDRGEAGARQLASQRPGDITQCTASTATLAVLRLERADGWSLAEAVDGRQDARRGHRPVACVRDMSRGFRRAAPNGQGVTRKHTGSIRPRSNAVQAGCTARKARDIPDTSHHQWALTASGGSRIPSARSRPMSKASDAALEPPRQMRWRSIARALSLQPRYAGARYLRRATEGRAVTATMSPRGRCLASQPIQPPNDGGVSEYRPSDRFWPYVDVAEEPSDRGVGAARPRIYGRSCSGTLRIGPSR